MDPIVIDIPGVGPVEFPATMSQDEVNAASKRLYDEANKEPVVEKESPELMGYLGAGAGAVGAAGDVIYSKGRPLIRMGEKMLGMDTSAPTAKPRTFADPSTVAQQAIERRMPVDPTTGGAVKNWAQTQHTGEFLGGNEYGQADRIKKEAMDFETKNPGQKVLPGSLLAVPENEAKNLSQQKAALAAEQDRINQAEVQKVAQTRAERLGERADLKEKVSRKNIATGAGSIATKVGAPILGGYELGSQGAQAYNRLTRPDLQASDVAAGATNIVGSGAGALSMLPGKFRIPAAILAQGAGAVANWLDKRNPRDEEIEKKAAGGLIQHFAGLKSGAVKQISKKLSKNLDLGNVLPSSTFKAAPEQTVTNPLRNEFPGVYKRPDVIAQEAALRVAPEDPMLKRLFGVTRDDLFEMSKRQGNVPGFIPGASVNPKGSAAAESVINPRNTQRLVDVLSEVKTNAPDLYKGMHAWYTMDPQYHRMVELMGEEKAKQMYHRLNTFGGIESPNLPVPVEFNRASAANWLAEQGRMPDWIKYGGLRDKHLIEGMPEDIMGVPGRVGHQRASASQQKFMDTGEHGMISPKAPPYIQASSVPELGFQTDLPVGDAHWSRFIGLPDVRTSKEVSASVSTPELQQLAPWWKKDVAGAMDLESVPAQAIMWGAGSPQTGVKTAIGAGKLELQAIQIAEAAKRLGISPENARDLILMGEARAGKAEGGSVEGYAPGGKVAKEALEAFKKKFTTGFYHGSPSNKIEAFDPTKSSKDPMYTTPQATFVTRDPQFAESFLSANNNGKVKSGSTMYPVSINLGKHWHPETPEGKELIQEFIEKYPKRVNLAKNLKRGDWTAVENADFIRHLQDTGHDTFHVMEGGVPNVGVFEPQNIRGKFAEYDPEQAANPDFMKAEGGLIHLAGGGKIPEAVVKAYKLFRTKGGNTDELYPLFVNANKPVPLNEWVNAEVGPVAASGKVKSKLGELAYRPGWHAGDLPIATHIGGKSAPGLKAPDFRRPEEVWAEVEMPADVDWQAIANQRARLNKAGEPIASTAHITDQIPEGGHYRYKTSPNMQGNWLIGGGMKVNKVLTDEEVQAINEAAGVADLPRFTKFKE
jgi:hypothetical protein